MEVASTAATWAGIGVQKNLTFRVVQTCHLQTTSSWLSSLCGPNSHHPFHPLPTQPLSQKKPLTRWTKFHWPSFVDLSGMAAVFKQCLLGFFFFFFFKSREVAVTVVQPPRDTQEEPLPSPPRLQQVQRRGSMTSLYQMEEVWGVWQALLARPCNTSSLRLPLGELEREYSADRPQRGKPYILKWHRHQKVVGFLASTAACHAAFITVCSGLLLAVVIYVGSVLPLSPNHNRNSQQQVRFLTVKCIL